MNDKDEKLLMYAFFLLVIGWSLDMFVHWIPSWISWGIMIVSVGLAVAYKIRRDRKDKKNKNNER